MRSFVRWTVVVAFGLVVSVACKERATSKDRQQRPTDVKNEKAPSNKVAPTDSKIPASSEKNTKTAQPAGPSKITTAMFGGLKKIPVNEAVEITPLKNGSVLLIVYDALNAGHLSAYGYARKTSPTMDQVAANGLMLTNYVSNSSWTRPSFTTIVTGVPKKVHQVEAVGGWRLEPEIETVAERFRKAGYRTAGFTGNPLVRKAWGFDQGYQHYEDTVTRDLAPFCRDKIWINGAIEWLEGVATDQPFFMMLFLTASHPPYRPPAEPRQFLAQVPQGEIIEHPFREYPEPLPADDDARIEAAYDDEIFYMDGQVKRLLDFLDSSGRADNLVVTMTADHGEMMGEHNSYIHAYHMWEQNVRVPFIMRAPNLPLKDAIDERPFTHVDVVPTLLDMVGIAYDPKDLPGISIVRALADPRTNQQRLRYTQVDAHGVSRQTVRRNGVKFIHYDIVPPETEHTLDKLHPGVEMPNPRDLPSLNWDAEHYEMFNVQVDPLETTNLIDDENYADLRSRLQVELNQKRGLKGSTQDDKKEAMSPEMLEALKNAGYIR